MKRILILLSLILCTTFANAQNPAFQIKDSLVELNSIISSAEFVYSGKIDIAPIPDVLRNCLQTNVAYENDETTITIKYDQMCQFTGSVRLELLDVKNATNLRGDRPKIYVYFGQTADVLIITDRRELETNLPTNYYDAINSYIDKAADLGLSAKYVEINNLVRKEPNNDTLSFIADNYYAVNYQYSSDKEDVQNTIKEITSIMSPKLLYILGGYDIIPTFNVPQSEVVFHQKMQSDDAYGLNLDDAREITVVQSDAIDEGYIYAPTEFQKLTQVGPANYAIPIGLQNHDVKYDAKGSSFYSQRRHGRHNGIDFFAPIGVPVYAADSGIINDARFVKESCGNMIVLKTDSENQIDWFKYCHLDHFAPGIQKGMRVVKGQLIAYSGNSQAADTGAHLHFEAYIGGTWASEKNKATAINAVTLYPNINFPTTSYKELNELSIDTQEINNLITARLYTSNLDENPAKTIADYLSDTNEQRTLTNPAFILRTDDEKPTNINTLFKHFQNTPCDAQNNCFEVPLICLDQNNCNETSKDTLQKYNVIILNLHGTPNSSFVKIKEEKIQFTTAKELFNSIQKPSVIIAEQANALNVLDENGVEIDDSYALQATEHSSTIIGRNGPYVLKLLEYTLPKDYTAFELASQMKATSLNQQNTISILQWLTAKQISIAGDPLAKINLKKIS